MLWFIPASESHNTSAAEEVGDGIFLPYSAWKDPEATNEEAEARKVI